MLRFEERRQYRLIELLGFTLGSILDPEYCYLEEGRGCMSNSLLNSPMSHRTHQILILCAHQQFAQQTFGLIDGHLKGLLYRVQQVFPHGLQNMGITTV